MGVHEFGMLADRLVPITALLTTFGIVAVIQYFRYQRNQALQATIRAAIEKGQELPMEALEAISQPKKPEPKKDQDLRRGVVLIAVGLGIGAFGYLIGDEDAFGPMMGIGSIPLLIGLGLTLLWVLRSRHDQ